MSHFLQCVKVTVKTEQAIKILRYDETNYLLSKQPPTTRCASNGTSFIKNVNSNNPSLEIKANEKQFQHRTVSSAAVFRNSY